MPGSYDEQWSRYKRIKWAWYISFLGFLPAIAIEGLIDTQIFHGRLSGDPTTVFALIWFFSAVVLNFVYVYWPCPRCGKPFVNNGNWRWWANACVHCGLPKYSDPLNPGDAH
jgi:hypothetical protein